MHFYWNEGNLLHGGVSDRSIRTRYELYCIVYTVKAKHVKTYKISPHADRPPHGRISYYYCGYPIAELDRISVAWEFLVSTLGLHEIACNYNVFIFTLRKHRDSRTVEYKSQLSSPRIQFRERVQEIPNVNDANYTFHYRSACFSFYRGYRLLPDRSHGWTRFAKLSPFSSFSQTSRKEFPRNRGEAEAKQDR